MTRVGPIPRLWVAAFIAILVMFPARGLTQRGGESVQIALPISVAFYVTDASAPTPATGLSLISFTNAVLKNNRQIKIDVKADASQFTAPFGAPITAGSVSWVVASPTNGTGSNGALSTTFADVYLGNSNATSGGVTLNWTLAPLSPGIGAASHIVWLTWRIRSV